MAAEAGMQGVVLRYVTMIEQTDQAAITGMLCHSQLRM